MCADALRRESESGMLNFEISGQKSLLPLLQIAHQTEPFAMTPRLEHLLVVGRSKGFEQEHLYQGSRIFTEMQACLYHLRVIEYHQRPLWQMVRKMAETILPYFSMAINQQLGLVALWQGVFGYSFIGQLIMIILDAYVFCINHYSTSVLVFNVCSFGVQNYSYFFV